MPSAVVLKSPYAGREPVKQVRGRGRFPRKVVHLDERRVAMWQRTALLRDIDRRQRLIASMEETLGGVRHELAVWMQTLNGGRT